MSLEQEIASLVQSTNRLTDSAMQALRHSQDLLLQSQTKFEDLAITTPTTLNVGIFQPYTSIQAAWDALLHKIILAPVTIKIEPGIYTEYIAWMDQPYAHNIHIQGAGVDQTILQAPDGDARYIIYCRNIRALTLAGITIKGLYNPNNASEPLSSHGLGAFDHSYIYIQDGSIKVTDCWAAMYTNANSCIIARKAQFIKNRHAVVADGGYIGIEESNLVGCGRFINSAGVLCAGGGTINATEVNARDYEFGFNVERGSTIHASRAHATQCNMGFRANFNGTLLANESSTDNVNQGYYAEYNASIWAPNSRARICTTGYVARLGASIYAVDSQTEDCTDGYYAETFGTIEAFRTINNAKNVTRVYSPAQYATLGNDNGLIRWS